MHIPWTWAKQRPQFIAQELNDSFDVTVALETIFNKKSIFRNCRSFIAPLQCFLIMQNPE
jgi:hypothetical protein